MYEAAWGFDGLVSRFNNVISTLLSNQIEFLIAYGGILKV